MNRRIILLLATTSLVLVPFVTPLYGQMEEGEKIVLSERVGDEIDQNERETYGLFPGVEGFQSAVILRVSRGLYRLRITYVDSAANEMKVRSTYQSEERVAQIRERIERCVREGRVTQADTTQEQDTTSVVAPEKESVRLDWQAGFADGKAAAAKKSQDIWYLAGAAPGFFFPLAAGCLYFTIWDFPHPYSVMFGTGLGLDLYAGVAVYKKTSKIPGELSSVMPVGPADYQSGFAEGYRKAVTNRRRWGALLGCTVGAVLGCVTGAVVLYNTWTGD